MAVGWIVGKVVDGGLGSWFRVWGGVFNVFAGSLGLFGVIPGRPRVRVVGYDRGSGRLCQIGQSKPTEARLTLASNLYPAKPLEVVDLGRMPYARALAVQREMNLAVSRRGAGEAPGPGEADRLLLVEHDPVITVTHRPGVWDNLLATPDRLKEMGIAVEVTDRGGDVTYHGPGQLVAYPILQLKPLGLNLGSYMRLLEQVVIDVLAEFGVVGRREAGAIGVWVDRSGLGSGVLGLQKRRPEGGGQQVSTPDTLDPIPQTRLAKVCALGVRVRKNTTMHGLALNVTTDLSHFKAIDPCGLGGRPVTSLAELLGDDVPGMDEVKGVLVGKMRSAIGALASKDSGVKR